MMVSGAFVMFGDVALRPPAAGGAVARKSFACALALLAFPAIAIVQEAAPSRPRGGAGGRVRYEARRGLDRQGPPTLSVVTG
jgi:hypothetical protein